MKKTLFAGIAGIALLVLGAASAQAATLNLGVANQQAANVEAGGVAQVGVAVDANVGNVQATVTTSVDNLVNASLSTASIGQNGQFNLALANQQDLNLALGPVVQEGVAATVEGAVNASTINTEVLQATNLDTHGVTINQQ